MKKILYLIIVIFSAICCVYTIIIDSKEINKEIGWVNYVPVEKENEWNEIELNHFKYRIDKNSFYKEIEETGIISIPELKVSVSSNIFYKGQVIKSGTIIDDYKFNDTVRIKDIKDGYLICDDLSNTIISMPYYDKVESNFSLAAYYVWFSKKYEVKFINAKYDCSKKCYMFSFSIENDDGFFLDNMRGRIKGEFAFQYDEEGFYVPKEYVSFINDKTYINKYYYDINETKEKYKTIQINIKKENNGFYLIDGENIKNGNYIVKWA